MLIHPIPSAWKLLSIPGNPEYVPTIERLAVAQARDLRTKDMAAGEMTARSIAKLVGRCHSMAVTGQGTKSPLRRAPR